MSKPEYVPMRDTILTEDRLIGDDGRMKFYVGVKLVIVERHGIILTEVGMKDGQVMRKSRRDVHTEPKPTQALASALRSIESRVAEYTNEFQTMMKARKAEIEKKPVAGPLAEPEEYEVPEA